MTFQQTLDYLYSTLPMYQRVGAVAFKKDLTNTVKLCDALDNPHLKFKSVHVAGTNGKGSSSHMIAAILQSAGYKTGLYTSPHLKRFTERIKVDGVEMEESAVVDFVHTHSNLLTLVKPSFFETTVAMAFNYFAQNEVDIAIIEVGLGGRLDSTNILSPLVSLITNIGYDHQQMLGESLKEIATEKAGIIKKNTPVIIGEKQEGISEIFIDIAKDKYAPLSFASDNVNDELFNDITLDLKGDYQKNNVPGVLNCVSLLNDAGFTINEDHIKNGLGKTSKLTGIKGRWQLLSASPNTICDTAHNKAGVIAVIEQLRSLPYSNLHIVWGMVNDKDVTEILALLPKEAKYYFCKPNVPRGLEANILGQFAKQVGLIGRVVNDVNEAIIVANRNALNDDVIFIGGSTFVVAEIENL